MFEQDRLIRALDHAKIAQGPGGPSEMLPGQHHVRLNMYIARASNGVLEIAKNLGVLDPKECVQGNKQTYCTTGSQTLLDISADRYTDCVAFT